MAKLIKRARLNSRGQAHRALPNLQSGTEELKWTVQPSRGRSWDFDLTKFGLGGDGNSARPTLIYELVGFIRADSTGRKNFFRDEVNRFLGYLWSFLDMIERRTGGVITRVADLTPELGHLFRHWLLAELGLSIESARKVSTGVRRILEHARKLHGVPNWRLPWPSIKRDNGRLHRDVDPAIFVPLYHELKRRHRLTHTMIARGAELLPQGKDPRRGGPYGRSPSAEREAFSVSANVAWLAKAWLNWSLNHPKTTMRAFGGELFCKDRDGGSREIAARPFSGASAFDVVRWFVPTVEDCAVAFFLVLLHTGWNPETVEHIDVSSLERWCDFRLGTEEEQPEGSKAVAIFGYKDRPGKEQIAFSLVRPTFHPYQVIASMIRWTEPLRAALRVKLAHLLLKKRLDRREQDDIQVLREYIASPWLYYSIKPGLACGLRIATFKFAATRTDHLRRIGQAAYQNAVPRAQSAEHRTALVGLTTLLPSDFRDGFSAFQYDNSLCNILLVKRALAHGSLRTTRHYLRQRRHIAQRFREFRSFQTAFFDEVRQFRRIDPTILFLRVRFGALTREQRARLADHRSRTRMGMGCVDPGNPPREISGRQSGPCRVHRCTICRHGVVFDDSLSGVARRAAELRVIRGRTAAKRFQESSFQDEWAAIEFILNICFEERAPEFWEAADRHYDDLVAGRAYLFDQVPSLS